MGSTSKSDQFYSRLHRLKTSSNRYYDDPLLISRRANADDFGHSYEANESKPCPARLNLGLGLTWAIHSKRSERIKSKERF